MKARSVSKVPARSFAVRARKTRTPYQASQSAYLKRIAGSLLNIFALKKKTDAGYDLALGDQVELPKEFLETVTPKPSSKKGKLR